MGQSSYVYILWLVLLAAGLWIILSFGSLLHAREDLAGEWELRPEQPKAGAEVSRMKVEQSGRYLKLTLSDGSSLKMKMIDESVVDQRFFEHKRIVLAGDNSQATFEGRASGDLWRLSLEGAVQGQYVARLTDRMYPKPVPATQRVYEKPSLSSRGTPRDPANFPRTARSLGVPRDDTGHQSLFVHVPGNSTRP